MKIIVTGGAGFVGSHLTELLIKNGHFPIIIDNLNTGKFKYIKKFVDEGKADFIKFCDGFCGIFNHSKCEYFESVEHVSTIVFNFLNSFNLLFNSIISVGQTNVKSIG